MDKKVYIHNLKRLSKHIDYYISKCSNTTIRCHLIQYKRQLSVYNVLYKTLMTHFLDELEKLTEVQNETT